MIIQFDALKVGKGDSFLLQADTKFYLFDGGEYYGQVTGFLKQKGIVDIDIVICSHNDSDHTNGLIGLLESHISVREVWLPATWRDFLVTAAKKECWPASLLEELIFPPDELPERYEAIVGGDFTPELDKEYIEETSEDDCLTGILAKFADLECTYIPHTLLCGYLELPPHFLNNIIIAGEKIIKIVKCAWDRGCHIRFFQYLSSGNPHRRKVYETKFIPLNCREISKIRKYKRISDALFLTLVNKESLVFQYDGGDNCIVFTADSNFKFLDKTMPLPPAIVTAPHHGASDNAKVYSMFSVDNIVWVRSDSKNPDRPCMEYISQKTRYCTICNNGNLPKQAVVIQWDGNNWVATDETRPCRCQ
jgi:hypothetical protein